MILVAKIMALTQRRLRMTYPLFLFRESVSKQEKYRDTKRAPLGRRGEEELTSNIIHHEGSLFGGHVTRNIGRGSINE